MNLDAAFAAMRQSYVLASGALPGALVALRYGPPLLDFTVLVRRGR